MHGFPPTILTTGTRDLLLSNTVRAHRKLRRAGVEATLQVYEGESHAQYEFDDTLPESKEAFGEIASFFGRISESRWTQRAQPSARLRRDRDPRLDFLPPFS